MPIYGRVTLCYFINGYGFLSFFGYSFMMYAKQKGAWIQIGGKNRQIPKIIGNIRADRATSMVNYQYRKVPLWCTSEIT